MFLNSYSLIHSIKSHLPSHHILSGKQKWFCDTQSVTPTKKDSHDQLWCFLCCPFTAETCTTASRNPFRAWHALSGVVPYPLRSQDWGYTQRDSFLSGDSSVICKHHTQPPTLAGGSCKGRDAWLKKDAGRSWFDPRLCPSRQRPEDPRGGVQLAQCRPG